LCPGLFREPKHSHLKELHRAVKLCEQALVSVDPAITTLVPCKRYAGQPFSSLSELYIIYWSLTYTIRTRPTSSNLHLVVQLSLQTTILTPMRMLYSTMSNTAYHIGRLASFLIAKMLFLTVSQ
uniref:Uncharacterized protein n=1 Tax=Zea mays TaxID=4577 RepID=A0A804NK10_MAIZE